MVLGQENLRRLHVNTEMKIFWEEYEPVLEELAKELGLPFVKEKPEALFKALKASLATVPSKSTIISQIQYKWLLSHKPKSLRDGILNEVQAVGGRHMSEEWRTAADLWLELQKSIVDKLPLPAVTEGEKVDEDNLPKKVFADYSAFLADFAKALAS